MRLYSASQAAAFAGKLIKYRHMASDDVYGPVRVVAIHAGSDQLIASGDSLTGRTFSLPLCVTMLEFAGCPIPSGEVQP